MENENKTPEGERTVEFNIPLTWVSIGIGLINLWMLLGILIDSLNK